MWIVDFPPGTGRSDASRYEAVFEHVNRVVYPVRRENRRAAYAERWWMHVEARPEMRRALAPLSRYLGTPRVTKHRLFVWLRPEVLADAQLIVFAVDDDYTFGLLHSGVHEAWARAEGSQLREQESGFRYTPTSTFETFPVPEPTEPQRQAVATAARELDTVRARWLNPPEWTREEALTFPASVVGPWRHLVEVPNGERIGTARYVRLVPADEAAARALARRTLTALYNERPTWLRDLHAALDATVLAVYGLSTDATAQQVLAHLLALNLVRATAAVVV
jgi:hypothetical protein